MNAGESAILEPGRVPCVTPEQIDKLLDRVTYSTHLVPGTTSVVAAAIAPGGHVLCVVERACPSRATFNLVLAIEMAIGKAKGEAARLFGERAKRKGKWAEWVRAELDGMSPPEFSNMVRSEVNKLMAAAK